MKTGLRCLAASTDEAAMTVTPEFGGLRQLPKPGRPADRIELRPKDGEAMDLSRVCEGR